MTNHWTQTEIVNYTNNCLKDPTPKKTASKIQSSCQRLKNGRRIVKERRETVSRSNTMGSTCSTRLVNKLVNKHQPTHGSSGRGCSDWADRHVPPGTPTASTPGTAAVKSRRRVWCAQDKHQCRSGAYLTEAILARKVLPFYPPAFVASFFCVFSRSHKPAAGVQGGPRLPLPFAALPSCLEISDYIIFYMLKSTIGGNEERVKGGGPGKGVRREKDEGH